MTETSNVTKFDPNDHLVQIKTKEGLKPFLKATSALNWFYHENPLPKGRIITDVVSVEALIIRAEVWIEGVKVATGHANSDGNSNTLKKIESAAIRRALANAGYGTDQVVSRLAKSIGTDEAKKLLGSNGNGERRMGGTTSSAGYQIHELYNAVLKEEYNNNHNHMKASVGLLLADGKLPPALTLAQAIEVVRNRHKEEKSAELTEQVS